MEDSPNDGARGPTQRVGPSASERSFARLRLSVVVGPDAGRELIADERQVSIGTSAGNHLVLTDPSVSRHHVEITLTRRGARIRDLGSTNGIRVDGVEIFEAVLRPGARIQIGGTTLEVSEDGVVREPLSTVASFADLLGESAAMRRMFEQLPRIAAVEATVLLTGETGCGKSLIARAIHRASARRDGPFIVVDCGAIPPTLIESELFGHVKGAFTGAHRDRLGAFRAAAGGTVLLEEIGELPLDLQPKLLRALEERVVTPVGDERSYPLDIRILSATHRDLRERVNAGSFRGDLYYRLHVLNLHVPALRDRRGDVRTLADHFHRELTGEPAPAALLDVLEQRDWPGNVRELRAAVERTVVLGLEPGDDGTAMIGAPSAAAEPVTIDPSLDPALSFREAKEHATAVWESRYLDTLLERHRGNVSSAARTARMDRNHLRDLLRRHGIEPRGR